MKRNSLGLTVSAVVGAVVFLSGATGALADAAAGKKMAKARCQVCHGIDGIAKIPIAPHLAGESQIYLETQLKAFRIGKREHEMMSVVAKELSDEDITNLARWYSSIKITATVPE
jgi:cytochrome c553